jgi:hypothetical protein
VALSGAQCSNENAVIFSSHEWAILTYLNYQFDPDDTCSWRSEWCSDCTGQRTGLEGNGIAFDLRHTHGISTPNASVTGYASGDP